MTMQFEIQSGGGPPEGFYKCRFKAIEPSDHDEYGPGLRFEFEVLDGEHQGMIASRITNATPTPRNAAGRMISGISGASLKPGLRIDLEPFVGNEYLVQVEATANGQGTRISSVMPNWNGNGEASNG